MPQVYRYKGTGRRGDFGKTIRQIVGDDGEAIAELAWSIANGDLTVERFIGSRGAMRIDNDGSTTTGPERVQVEPTIQERLDALEFLASYGYGKPRQSVEFSGPDGGPITIHDLSRLSVEELRAWRAMMEKAKPDEGPIIDVTPERP